MIPTDLNQARDSGPRLLKYFPVEAAAGIKALPVIGGPCGDVRFIAVGQFAENTRLAAYCLKHNIPGDANLVTIAEVERLMQGDTSGQVQH